MKWIFSALVIIVIILSIIILCFEENKYIDYEKASWANNTGVLGLLSALSLLLLGYACQIGYDIKKCCGPLLCLTLIFVLLWVYSLTCMSFFTLTCICSWILFVLSLTIVIILAKSEEKAISLIALPFLAISLLALYISHDILSKNYERPEHVSYD